MAGSIPRDFIDQVVTSTLVFEGGGVVNEYVGGYKDWVRQTGGALIDELSEESKKSMSSEEANSSEGAVAVTQKKIEPKRKKLSYKLQRELDSLPEKISDLEAQVENMQQEVSRPDFYAQDRAYVDLKTSELTQLQESLEVTIERWMELEEMAG